MLTPSERLFYTIAMKAATGESFDEHTDICPLCNGTGLLRHPTEYMGVAQCYMCSQGLVEKGKHKIQPKFDRRECCNAQNTNTKGSGVANVS